MKRSLLIAVSICLVLASVFGIFASSNGLGDITEILRKTNLQTADINDSIDLISERYDEIRGTDADAKSYAEGLVTDEVGSAKLNQGQAEYNKGQAQLAAGQKEYDAAKSKLDKGKSDYAAAEATIAQKEKEIAAGEKEIAAGEKKIADAKAQLADAKAQRDAGQAKLDQVTHVYNTVKPMYDKLNGNTAGEISSAAINRILREAGYNDINQVFSAYESGQAQIADANAQIAQAEKDIAAGEKQLADGKAQLADGKAQLADGKSQLADAKKQLDAGEKELANGKAKLDNGKAELASAEKQLAAGRKAMADNSSQMAEDLEKLEGSEDATEVVESGIQILLANDGIAAKVTNPEDYDEVLAAAREYVDEETANVSAELAIRQHLYSLLRILCVVGILAGAAGIAAAILPKAQTLITSLALNAAAAIGALALNVYGMLHGYRYFVYSLGDNSGTGSLQNGAIMALAAVAVIAAIMSYVCLRAYRIGEGKVVPKTPVVEEAPVPKKSRRDEDEDDEGWATLKAGPALPQNKQPAPEKKQQPAPKQTKKPEKKPEKKPAKKAEAVAPNDELIERMQAQTQRLNEETERLESESRLKDFELARREYEEALRKFEEARKGM